MCTAVGFIAGFLLGSLLIEVFWRTTIKEKATHKAWLDVGNKMYSVKEVQEDQLP
jgi:hypothetical protein